MQPPQVWRSARRLAVLLVSSAACASGTAPGVALSRVDGELRIGPTQPVCQADMPCDAPLDAGFTLRQAGRIRSRLHSDAAGRFTVTLPIGTYDAVLDPDAPASVLGLQTQPVTVGPDSVTTVIIVFDTGIR
jgi:hypothetical protein